MSKRASRLLLALLALPAAALAQFPPQFTILFDPKRGVAAIYGLKGVPSSYLIDRAGNLVSVQLGFSKPREAELEGRIEKLLSDTKN